MDLRDAENSPFRPGYERYPTIRSKSLRKTCHFSIHQVRKTTLVVQTQIMNMPPSLFCNQYTMVVISKRHQQALTINNATQPNYTPQLLPNCLLCLTSSPPGHVPRIIFPSSEKHKVPSPRRIRFTGRFEFNMKIRSQLPLSHQSFSPFRKKHEEPSPKCLGIQDLFTWMCIYDQSTQTYFPEQTIITIPSGNSITAVNAKLQYFLVLL